MRESRHPPALVDAVLERYLEWREASRTVSLTYGTWRDVEREQRPRAYADYCAALDAEERAADAYRILIDRIQTAGRR